MGSIIDAGNLKFLENYPKVVLKRNIITVNCVVIVGPPYYWANIEGSGAKTWGSGANNRGFGVKIWGSDAKVWCSGANIGGSRALGL